VSLKSKLREVTSTFACQRETRKRSRLLQKTLYCSFCGKSQHSVAQLIAGPSVFICNECIDLCVDIVAAETGQKRNGSLSGEKKSAAGTKSQEPGPLPTLAIADVQSMSTARLLQWLKFQEKLLEQSRAGLQDAVDTLRGREVSWATIGEALGVSRQAAWERFS